MEIELSEMLGRKVDLNTPGFLSKYFRDRVIQEAEVHIAQHDDDARMRHMLNYARKAVRFASDRTRGDLDTDEVFGLAMTRLLEVIGEAASRVGSASREQYPQIPWLSIAGNSQPSDSRLRPSRLHDFVGRCAV